jgi:hypothetical protein
MDPHHNAPPGWRFAAYPWFAMDEVEELPSLIQVGPILLPQYFHFMIGTAGMWEVTSSTPETDFVLYANLQIAEGKVFMANAECFGMDISSCFAAAHKVLPPKRWVPTAIHYITQYLAAFVEQEGVPDLPFNTWDMSAVQAGRNPRSAVEWRDKLMSQAAESYAIARNEPPPGKRRRLTLDFLKEVARIYTINGDSGIPPTRAVADHFKAPHSTAAKWVGGARKKGLLPPVDREE